MNDWKRIGSIVVFGSAAIVLGGCAAAGATSYPQQTATTPVVDRSEADAEIRSLRQDVESRNSRIAALQTELTSASQTKAPLAGALFPPNAKPGQCYARVLTPEKYRNLEERVLVRDASENVSIVPASFKTVQERVVVKEASTRIEMIPAKYETVTERVLVRPATTNFVKVAATFRTETERVLDKPAYSVWKRGPASDFADSVLSEKVTSTGEVMCLVEVPATYKTITRKVLDKEAHTQKVEEPAEYKTVTKRVVKSPATTREVVIPAEYQTVSVRKLVKPATESRSKVPAEYQTVTKTEKVADAELAWQEVVCAVNTTRANVVALQKALDSKGYQVGPIDGVLGRQTFTAVGRYATDQGIPHGSNYVPVEVVKSLKLKI